MAPVDRALTVLSCFSGAGGLDLGLEAAGFRTVGCIEIDGQARKTLKLNRPDWRQLEPHDIVAAATKLGPEDIELAPGELDLIAGGPPCQPFSKAAQWALGQSRGLQDPRGQAALAMLDLVERFLPKAILIENVTGFLAGEHSAAKAFEKRLTQINNKHQTSYVLRSHVVDAADYGVPQHRRRLLATAFSNGHQLDDAPITTHTDAHVRAGDALADVHVATPPAPAGKWAALLPCIPEGSNYQYLTAKGGGPELFGYRTRYWSFLLKLARDEPSWTLPASPGPSTGPFHWDNRPLAASERLALQGFPSTWKLAGDERVLTRLAGNATPPPLAEAAGRQIACVLSPGHKLQPGTSALAKPRRAKLAAAVPPLPEVPDEFAKEVGPKQAHPGPGAGPAHLKVPN